MKCVLGDVVLTSFLTFAATASVRLRLLYTRTANPFLASGLSVSLSLSPHSIIRYTVRLLITACPRRCTACTNHDDNGIRSAMCRNWSSWAIPFCNFKDPVDEQKIFKRFFPRENSVIQRVREIEPTAGAREVLKRFKKI